MPSVVSIAVLHGDPPHVIVAEDLTTLNWRIALELVAQTPPADLPELEAEQIREDLLEEQWGAAVERWVRCTDAWLDVYESWELHRAAEVELAPAELQFTPLFRDSPDVPDRLTTITELVTGLGMLGYDDVGEAVRPDRRRW